MKTKSTNIGWLVAFLFFFLPQNTNAQQLDYLRSLGGSLDDYAHATCIDANGYIYVVGSFGGTVDFDPGAGVSELTAVAAKDAFILKLNDTGSFIWVKHMRGLSASSGSISASSIAVSGTDLYIGGTYSTSMDADPSAGEALFGVGVHLATNSFITKLNTSGGFLWARNWRASNNYLNALAPDGTSVVVGLTFKHSMPIDPSNYDSPVIYSNNNSMDCYIIRLDEDGLKEWSTNFGGPDADEIRGLAVDASSNIYISGNFRNTVNFNNLGSYELTSAGYNDIFVMKLASNFSFQWAKSVGGTSSDYSSDLALDAAGNVVSTGYFAGDNIDFDPGAGTSLLSSVSADIFVQKLEPDGDFIWAKSFGGTSYDVVYDLNTDLNSNIYLTGNFNGTVDFDPGAGVFELTSAGSNDIYATKLTAAGELGWAVRMGGADVDIGRGIAVDPSGKVVLTGYYQGTSDFDPGAGVSSATSNGLYDTFIQKLSPDGVNPTVSSFSPVDGANTVSIDANLVLNFSENVKKGTGNIVLYKSGGQVIETFSPSSTAVTVSGATVTINPSSNLLNGTGYYVQIAMSAIKDVAGNNYAGISNTTTWNFTTVAATNDPPTNILLSFNAINENNAINAVIGTLSTTDPDPGSPHTYSIVSGTGDTDNASFHLADNQLRASEVFDFESKSSYSVRINTFDGVNNFAKAFTINITNVAENNAPTNITLTNNSINENNSLGATIGTFSTTDPDGGTHSYALVSGTGSTNNANFTIAGNALKANTVFDYETKTSYSIRVRTSDGTATFDKIFTININDLVDTDIAGPVVTSLSPADGVASVPLDGTLVMTFNENIALQASGGYVRVRKLSGDALVLEGRPLIDTDIFTIDGNTLTFSLADYTGLAPAFETDYYVTIDEYTLKDAAGNYYIGFMDNATWNFTSATELESDETAPVLVGLDPSNGSFDYAYDRGYITMTFSEPVVNNVVSSHFFHLRRLPGNQIVKQFSLNTSEVTIDGNKVTLNDVPDLSVNTTYLITCTSQYPFADLAGNEFESWQSNTSFWQFTPKSGAQVVSMNPTHNNTNVDTYASLEVVFDREVFIDPTYSEIVIIFRGGTPHVIFGPDSEHLTITGNALHINPWFDLNMNQEYGVQVHGLVNSEGYPVRSISRTDWVFTTNDQINNAPNNMVLSNTTINEGNAIGQTVGTIAVSDPNVEDVHTLSFQAGSGDTFNHAFTLFGNELRANQVFDYTTNTILSIRLLAEDDKGGRYEKNLFINVNAVPTDIMIDSDNINENNTIGWAVGVLSTVDQNNTNGFTYTLVDGDGGDDNASFTISSNVLKAAEVFDYETKSTYQIRVRTTDGLAAIEKMMTIHVNYVDNYAPTVVSMNPLDEATGVALDADLVLTFNEPIVAGTNVIYVTDATNGVSLIYGAVNTSPDLFTVSGETLTIHLANYNGPFEPSYARRYYVQVSPNAIRDPSGNSFDEFNNATSWNFTTEAAPDETAPTLLSKSPGDNATSVAKETNLVLTFNESVALGFGTIQLIDQKGSVVEQYSSGENASQVSILNNEVTIDPSVNLQANLDYHVLIESNALTDLAGNPYAGFNDEAVWNFKTLVVGQAPTDISISADHFDEDLASNQEIATLSATDPEGDAFYFELVQVDGSGTAYDDFYINGNKLYSGYNGYEYTDKSEYALRIKAIDNNNNTFEKDFTLYINDNEPPKVVSFSPGDNTTGALVSGVWTATFDEPIFLEEGGVQGFAIARGTSANYVHILNTDDSRISIDGNTLTIDLGFTLWEETDYWVWIKSGVIKDSDENYYNAHLPASTWNFTTGDFTAPSVTSLSPANNASGVSSTPELIMTFSENISFYTDAATAFFQINELNGPVNETINWTDPAVTVINDNQIKIALSIALSPGTTYWVQAYNLDNILVMDSYENELSPWGNDDTYWRFTTTKADQIITFEEISNKTFGDAPFMIDVEASSGLDVALTPLGPITINGNLVTITGAGAASINANQAGDEQYNAAPQVNRGFTIAAATQTITIDPVGNKLITDEPFDIVASNGASPMALSYHIESGSATVSGNTVTLNGTTGTVVIRVEAAGNANYASATEYTTFNVIDESLEDQTITFSVGDQVYGQTVSLNGAASSSLAVSYEMVSGPISLSGNSLVLTGVGTASIRALQSGNDAYNPADPVLVEFSISKAPLTITATDKSMVFGESLPELTMSYSGFVNGEGASSITLPTVATAATGASDAGTYHIELAGGAADNYSMTLIDGVLTVEKATATISLAELIHEADGTAKLPTVATDPADLNVSVTYDGVAEAPTAAGSYEVVATINESNYQGSVTGTLVINEATVTGIATQQVEISVFPNPAAEWLQFSGLSSEAQLDMVDIEGSQVLTRLIYPGDKVDISQMQTGMYVLHISNNHITTTTKILIHR
ncbi:Ig-like domain-containing protein [Reichenbachiella carrageenanivorans]|uniref:Ig-like domain-containing protein n=1 Tax=Reichenbachiella carrageenanivorans TaxID=2979869 RepID=A0ABY6D5E0_9BACT|nr:Ig-like domain-containing protein [Reichenbachiella carrageenanivorans]UXX80835.1 Ig-like domain-containing protein [Reichenbachiella carrageenanivorans]